MFTVRISGPGFLHYSSLWGRSVHERLLVWGLTVSGLSNVRDLRSVCLGSARLTKKFGCVYHA